MSGDDPQLRSGMIGDIEDIDRILGQFLEFAHVGRGEAPVDADLAALAREVAAHYVDTGYALETRIADGPAPPIRPVQIRRVLANLLDNAFRHAGADVVLAVRADGPAAII
jgi:two-component system osmolarity sensor histidine kinase EnvZ